MTADSVSEEMMRKIENGASLFITKPIDLDIVKEFINKELESNADFHGNGTINNDEYIEEKRQLKRKPYLKTVHYSVSVFYNWELKSNVEAYIIDMSRGGAGIRTSYPLSPGNVLRFNNVLDNTSGIVKWSMKDEKNYRAGIKFI
jgi:hypothetical protein